MSISKAGSALLKDKAPRRIPHASGQAGGLSLDEIHAILSPEAGARVDRSLLLAKADEIDLTIKRLQSMSDGLRHAAACPAANHFECPTVQKLLKAASAGRLRHGAARTTSHGKAVAAC